MRVNGAQYQQVDVNVHIHGHFAGVTFSVALEKSRPRMLANGALRIAKYTGVSAVKTPQ
jgi:hypothetical protein